MKESVQPPDRDTGKIEEEVCLSIVVPVSERHDNLKELFFLYQKELKVLGKRFEFIFVVDEGFSGVFNELKEMKRKRPEIKIIKLNRSFGEAASLSAGFKKACGTYILTLSSYFQVEPVEVRKVITALEEGEDMVITRRYPRVDSIVNRIQTHSFHWILRRLTGISFRDMSCGLRGMRRKVASEINLYGDLHRFIPILAYMQGFKIREIDVRQSTRESNVRIYRPGVYIRRLLDIFTVFFLFKFTKKPLRFFGLVGIFFFTVGFLTNFYLTFERLIGKVGLADRPLLLLGVLVMVLGIQIASIGLLGEIIIYTHARETKDYQIEEILD